MNRVEQHEGRKEMDHDKNINPELTSNDANGRQACAISVTSLARDKRGVNTKGNIHKHQVEEKARLNQDQYVINVLGSSDKILKGTYEFLCHIF